MGLHAYRQWLVLLDVQCGIADRSQAKQAGFSDRQIWHRLRSGKWQRVHEGVYATFTGPLTPDARLWAALRRAGDGAMLSHETAAEVHGLIDKPAGKAIHITVPDRPSARSARVGAGNRDPPIRPEPAAAPDYLEASPHQDRGHRA